MKWFAQMSPLQMRVIALCIAINLLDGFDILAMAYAAPAIGEAWSLSPERLGVLLSLGLAGMMAGSILIAPLADRFGRRPIILAALGVSAASMFLASQAASYMQLGIARLMTGLAVGAILPCINTMVAEYSPAKLRSFAVSLMQAGFAIGASAGGLIAVWLLAQFGWQAVFLAGGALTLLLVPAVFIGMPESLAFLSLNPRRAAERERLLKAMGESDTARDQASPYVDAGDRDRVSLGSALVPLGLVSLAFFTSLMGFYFLTSWMPKLLVDLRLAESDAVTAGALLTSGGIIAAFGLGWASLNRSIVPLVAVVAAASALFTAGFGQLPSEASWLLPAAFILGLAVNATQIGLYAIIPGLFPAHIRAGATGIAIGVGRSGAVAGPWVAGQLIGNGVATSSLFAIMAIPYVIGMIVLLMLAKWQKY